LKAALTILFLGLFAAFSITLKTELRREKSPLAALKIGEVMPDFELPDSSGKTVKLSEVLRDKKLVMVNFWATWCGPCRVEMPSFEKLYNEQKNSGFTILAIAEDKDRAKVDHYLEGKPVSFPVLLDQDGALAKQFKIESFPTTVLLDAEGKIQEVHEGVQPYLQYSVQMALKPVKRP
jgi:peroxiredoxin